MPMSIKFLFLGLSLDWFMGRSPYFPCAKSGPSVSVVSFLWSSAFCSLKVAFFAFFSAFFSSRFLALSDFSLVKKNQ